MRLDRFFSDEKAWQQVEREVANNAKLWASMKYLQVLDPSSGIFRVQVPKPYPGVQYRKSKRLDDRYPRYAKHGSTVTGSIEDDGEWLRIDSNLFLPMKVDNMQILQSLSGKAVESSSERNWLG